MKLIVRFQNLLVLIALCGGFLSAQAQTAQKFDFGAGKTEKGFVQVTEKDVYTAEKGFGFEPNQMVICADSSDKNALRSDFCTSAKPFYFSVKAAEGNYKVTVTFGDKTQATETTVKAELRRLMLENIKTAKGRFRTETFIVNVRRPQFPGGEVKLKDREKTMEWWAWDDKLTLEFNGARPVIDAVEIEKIDSIPTVFLLGDSTVCDQPREPYASWGQMLTAFFRPEIAIANNAESGESLKSSFGAKRLEKVLSQLKKGDFVLVQFAHNDEKEKGEGVGAMTTFKASLKQYVAAIRAKGATPILLTPMHRRTFDADGKITNSHGDYPEAVRRAASEENVPLIDLTALSKDFYEALGKEKSGAAFKEGDGTHHSNYGAYELAKMIAGAIRAQKLPPAKYLLKDLPAFDPKKPDSFETFAVPASPLATDVKPLGN
ncbi:MAG TPA: rhamnogalacturonan acetylesterase [Pyrinomonadaceae bacterium]|jgi:lysophospholipase L1-like esterase